MDRLNIGIIGTGNISRYHAAAYKSLDNCNIIACSDIVKEKAQVFAKTYNVSKIYQDYKKMLSKEELDVISICTWPHLHSKITIDSAKANVKAIHCEKPMSHTWGSAKKMYKECKKRNIQLTINHQRRFGKPFCIAKELLKAGEIGELKRLEGSRDNIFDWGTHYVDMFGFYNEETPADWVMGQIDYLDVDWSKEYYGAPVENHGVFLWKYKNGVFGFFGSGASRSAIGADNRLIGTEGIIEVGVIDGPILRIKNENSSKWEILDTNDEDLHGYINPNIPNSTLFFKRAISDVIDALLNKREPILSARNALKATEIIFACYESSRRRAMIRLPLQIEDNPLATMVKSGVFI